MPGYRSTSRETNPRVDEDETIIGDWTFNGAVDFSGASIVLGNVLYVDAATGDDDNAGTSSAQPFATLQAAVDAADAGSILYVTGGTDYEENVTITTDNLTVIGIGNRGSAAVVADTNGTAITIRSDDVTLINIGAAGDGTGGGLKNYGRRTRLQSCKIEGGTDALTLTLGTVAQIGAGTHGKGDDLWIVDCEICWATNGVKITASDYGAVTQTHFRNCTFHNNTAADFEESGGSVDIRFRNLDIGGCHFSRQEDGTEPTKYLSLNDDNGNKGIVHGNGGKNLVSTGVIWTGNFHTAGISTTQPS